MTDHVIDTDTDAVFTLQAGDSCSSPTGVLHRASGIEWLIDVVGGDVKIDVSGSRLKSGLGADIGAVHSASVKTQTESRFTSRGELWNLVGSVKTRRGTAAFYRRR